MDGRWKVFRLYRRRDVGATLITAPTDTTWADAVMRAAPGDRLVVHPRHVGEPTRDAEVLEVHGEDGGPPFLVRWSADGHVGLFFPSGDAEVHHEQPSGS